MFSHNQCNPINIINEFICVCVLTIINVTSHMDLGDASALHLVCIEVKHLLLSPINHKLNGTNNLRITYK